MQSGNRVRVGVTELKRLRFELSAFLAIVLISSVRSSSSVVVGGADSQA